MRGHSFVALYRSRCHAEGARDRLRGLGIPERDIELGDDERRLFGADIPPNDRFRYRAQLRDGRTAVCVRLRPDYDPDRLVEMIAETDPLDLDDDRPEGAAVDRRHRVRSLVAEPLLADLPLGRVTAGGKPRARSRTAPRG